MYPGVIMSQYRHTQALNDSKFREKVKHHFSSVNQNAKIFNIYTWVTASGGQKRHFLSMTHMQTHTDTQWSRVWLG